MIVLTLLLVGVTVIQETEMLSGVTKLIHSKSLTTTVDILEQLLSEMENLSTDTKKTGSFSGMEKSGFSMIL